VRVLEISLVVFFQLADQAVTAAVIQLEDSFALARLCQLNAEPESVEICRFVGIRSWGAPSHRGTGNEQAVVYQRLQMSSWDRQLAFEISLASVGGSRLLTVLQLETVCH
jgi:hypothetical protein